MKLTKLLSKIHRPYKAGDRIEGLKLRNIRDALNQRIALEAGEDEAFYIVHAVNVLPELVEAATQFKYEVLCNGAAKQTTIDALHRAIAAAEEVKE